MKHKLIISILFVFISGCAQNSYIPPKNAILTSVKIIGDVSKKQIWIYRLDSNGCYSSAESMTNTPIKLENNGVFQVESEKDLSITVGSSTPYGRCYISEAVNLKRNHEYFLTMRETPSYCLMSIIDVNEKKEIQPLEAKQMTEHLLFKTCK